jgi:hypothetical protein
MVDIRNALGVIKKTTDDVEFLLAFDAMRDRVQSRKFDQDAHPMFAMSGTHRIRGDDEEEETVPVRPNNVTHLTGNTRR